METLTQNQLDYHKDFIFKSRENKLQFFEALPNRFYSKDAIKLGLNFHMQSRTVGALLSSCMPYLLKQPRFGMYEKVKIITENLEIMKETIRFPQSEAYNLVNQGCNHIYKDPNSSAQRLHYVELIISINNCTLKGFLFNYDYTAYLVIVTHHSS